MQHNRQTTERRLLAPAWTTDTFEVQLHESSGRVTVYDVDGDPLFGGPFGNLTDDQLVAIAQIQSSAYEHGKSLGRKLKTREIREVLEIVEAQS